MDNFITNLQEKSDTQKGIFAVTVAVVITGFLFITWGYNFAHSGKINNLASSAVGVASVVESAQSDDSFNNVMKQLKTLGGLLSEDANKEDQNNNKPALNSVGTRHVNVFAPTGAEMNTQ